MIDEIKKRTRKEKISSAYTYPKTRKRTADAAAADADHHFEVLEPTRAAKAKRKKTAPPPKKQDIPQDVKQSNQQQEMTILDFMKADVKAKFQRLKKENHT